MAVNKKIIIVSLLCGLIAAALIVFVVLPLLGEIKKDSKDVVSAKDNLEIIQNRIDKINSAGALYYSMEGDLGKIKSFFIDPGTPIELIKFWEKLAAEANVSIDISPISSRDSGSGPWDRIGFQMRIDGSYIHFLRFLEKIENGPYLAEIKSLSVNKEFGSLKTGNGEVSAAIELNVFAKKK